MSAAAGEKVELLECGTSLAEGEFNQEEPTGDQPSNSTLDSVQALQSLLADSVLAGNTSFKSPFELKGRFLDVPLVYCDQTASNRPVASIESYLQKVCLPLYGNTHTNISITGSQSTAFVAEARQIVAEETNAKITGKASLDVVLFAGSGTTAAVELLIDCIGLKHAKEKPVVFVGPYEHHSNLIPWRESGCKIVMIPENDRFEVDLDFLERSLQKHQQYTLKMGTFTAASNVTGKVCDTNAIAAMLHRHGALAFFDYATGAPYLSMNMNPASTEKYSAELVAKDAIFFSPHKMLGGVGGPGVLIMKKNLVSQTNAPGRSGGGTVFYVTNTHHRFLSNRVERYEGGTPNVVGILRVGLALLLKRQAEQKYARLCDSTLPRTLEEFEFATYSRIAERLKREAPNLVLLGSDEGGPNLPIFSFLVRFQNRFLHYNYVCAVLNDLFGIQSRGGCQCAGPYAQRLLGLTTNELPNAQNIAIEEALMQHKERAELLRPGFTRLSLPFKGLRADQVEYVTNALIWVSQHAWAMMCQYVCNHKTGEWRHQSRQGKPLGRAERRWLSHFAIERNDFSSPAGNQVRLDATMAAADEVLDHVRNDQRSIVQALKMSNAEAILGEEDLEELRWYAYPKEVAIVLKGRKPTMPGSICGALNPLRKFSADQAETNSSSAFSAPGDEKKRKQTQNSVFGEARVTLDSIINDNSMVTFRDGDHSGVAPIDEVEAGIDDGELSEKCEVFYPQDDRWILLHSLMRSGKKTKPNAEMTQNEQKTASEISTMSKKANRDIATWGTGTVLGANETSEHNIKAESDGGRTSSQLSHKKNKYKHQKPPPKMMKLVTNALVQWEMIRDGDRLLLGLSGGKDSLSLLHCLLEFKRKLPIKFDIEVCTIDPMTPSFDPSPLIPYVESLGLKYHYIRDKIVERAMSSGKDGKVVTSLCAYCARMKRGNLYACARQNNCNKLVLAQHLDDCAESCFMSLMHNGFLRTMKANYEVNAGDISVIRPLVYCRESLMTDFAKTANLPVINENCPACFEEPKERARIKKLLSREETLYPNFYDNIKRAIIPLMHDDLTGIMRCYTEETLAKSKREKNGKRKRSPLQGSVYDKPGEEVEMATPLSENVNLCEASEEDLIKELARRKAEKFRQAGAMKRLPNQSSNGQVCNIGGGCTIFE